MKTKPVYGLAVDLPTNDATSNPPGVPLYHKSTSKTNNKSTKQPTDSSKDDINQGSTLDNDFRWCIAQVEIAVVSKSVTKKQKKKV